MSSSHLAIATERATEGGLWEPSENQFTATIVISNIAAWAGMAGFKVAVLSACCPEPRLRRLGARRLTAPRRAHFASHYCAAVATAVPGSLS